MGYGTSTDGKYGVTRVQVGAFDSKVVEDWIEEAAGRAYAYGMEARARRGVDLEVEDVVDEVCDDYYDEEHAFPIFAAYGWDALMYGGADPMEWFTGEVYKLVMDKLSE
jgi:hypothetical protein